MEGPGKIQVCNIAEASSVRCYTKHMKYYQRALRGMQLRQVRREMGAVDGA